MCFLFLQRWVASHGVGDLRIWDLVRPCAPSSRWWVPLLTAPSASQRCNWMLMDRLCLLLWCAGWFVSISNALWLCSCAEDTPGWAWSYLCCVCQPLFFVGGTIGNSQQQVCSIVVTCFMYSQLFSFLKNSCSFEVNMSASSIFAPKNYDIFHHKYCWGQHTELFVLSSWVLKFQKMFIVHSSAYHALQIGNVKLALFPIHSSWCVVMTFIAHCTFLCRKKILLPYWCACLVGWHFAYTRG
jgi:hypothetical protein